MRMVDIIQKKKEGEALSWEEIKFFVDGVTDSQIPDYQAAALLMAIYFNKMDNREVADLTKAMAQSGDMVDLSGIEGIKVDKHSTGGVGDKTTLVIAPIVAALGVPVAKMSGRGLGHTGGTVDKLESIPNFQTEIESKRFFEIVNEHKLCVIGQSGNIAPADKKLYALRDVTATVDSFALIASSIMSKKLAAGSDAILLDVKVGSGAFMRTVEDAKLLARMMVDIGNANGRKTAALITDMDIPLGVGIGNSLEVIEAVETLSGNGPQDLTEVCVELAANMLALADVGDVESCKAKVKEVIANGSALKKFRDMVEAQGGDASYIDDVSKFERAKVIFEIKADKNGYIGEMDTMAIGNACVILGAGRETKADEIDFSAGLMLRKKTGNAVAVGDVICELHTSTQELANTANEVICKAFCIVDKAPTDTALIHARVD